MSLGLSNTDKRVALRFVLFCEVSSDVVSGMGIIGGSVVEFGVIGSERLLVPRLMTKSADGKRPAFDGDKVISVVCNNTRCAASHCLMPTAASAFLRRALCFVDRNG